ncbi:MAG: LCP family protein [Chloroflexi bacterium]|nr:LCP family protein [Chloroflexota bacterium]
MRVKYLRFLLLVIISVLALLSVALLAPKDSDPLFKSLAKPFATNAERRREARSQTDPQFFQRVDAALNANRINVLLFGYGETHEPPMTERAIIGSFTLISYDVRTGQVDLISMTHDIRAPEVERALAQRGQGTHALKMDRAYDVGGFPLMREMIENGTGLAVDYQIVFKDGLIQRLVDQVFGGIQVDVPMAFSVQPFYLDGEKYPVGFFQQGNQTLNGRQVIQFIKTVPVAEGEYDPSLEHNVRKHLVLQALLDALNRQSGDRDFWLRLFAFVQHELAAGSVTMDFDPTPLVVDNLGRLLTNLDKLIAQRSSAMSMPAIHRATYIVDSANGDGGVQWVNANQDANPITRQDIDTRVYPNLDYEVPIDANPYGNLAREYWGSVREMVRRTLNGEPLQDPAPE